MMLDAITKALLALLQWALSRQVARDAENQPIVPEPLIEGTPLEFDQIAAKRRLELLKRIEKERANAANTNG